MLETLDIFWISWSAFKKIQSFKDVLRKISEIIVNILFIVIFIKCWNEWKEILKKFKDIVKKVEKCWKEI